MDELDRRILNEIQLDAGRPLSDLADKVHSSLATVHRRFQKLRNDGVITRIVALADAKFSDEPITVVLGVMIKNQRPKEQESFRKFIRTQRCVKMAWMTTGEFDYVLVGAFPDTASYKKFIEDDLSKNTNFSNFRTFVSVDEVKFETARIFA